MKPPTVIHCSPKRKASGFLLNTILVVMCASGWAAIITLHPVAVTALLAAMIAYSLVYLATNESPNEL